ncbi:MAG: kynureninase [Myxococcales bacterium]|nr:kynureninase [Myxococcales bacterium]
MSRWLSCFPGDARIVTTDREFHSLRRQLARSEESGLRVARVPVSDRSELAEAFLEVVDRERTDAAAFSSIFFTDSRRVADAEAILTGLAEREVPVLVDVYHAFNVVPLDVDAWPGQVFVVGGGYKYAQTGEGACWMLVPRDASRFRPEHTGWFADFENLESPTGTVGYGPGGDRFFGATFDPTPFYRGRAVLAWMDAVGLTTSVLAEAARLRTELIVREADRLDLESRGLVLRTPRDAPLRGGFLSFQHPEARGIKSRLKEVGVWTDAREDLLRLGPSPVTTSDDIGRALQLVSKML